MPWAWMKEESIPEAPYSTGSRFRYGRWLTSNPLTLRGQRWHHLSMKKRSKSIDSPSMPMPMLWSVTHEFEFLLESLLEYSLQKEKLEAMRQGNFVLYEIQCESIMN